jgi:hypothetical protein
MRAASIALILTLVVLFGSGPYLSVVFAWLMGDMATATIEADGTPIAALIGPNAPQPEWMPKEPGGVVASANRWQPSKYMKDGGGMDVVSRKTVADVKAYYGEALRQAGFAVEDPGWGPLNAGTAAALSLDGFLIAEDKTRNLEVVLQIGTPERSIVAKARVVKVIWRELWPGQASGLDAYRKGQSGGQGNP